MQNGKFYRELFVNYRVKNKCTADEQLLVFFELDNIEEIYNSLEKYAGAADVDYILEKMAEDLIFSKVAKAERSGMKLGLHRMENMLKALGNPEEKLKVIHIAGTNGKGSVSSYLRTVLSNKYKVGMYSSPGMIGFNDRIRINDDFITYREMYVMYQDILNIWDANFATDDDRLSFFEILTIMGILYFEKNAVDFVVMEVGLGGRFDGTNIFKNKLASVITKIGLDHTAILGNSLGKIAYEKAGIIQSGDNVFSYFQEDEAANVLNDVACEQNAHLSVLKKNDIIIEEIAAKYSIFSYKNYQNIKIKMLGEHQIYNCSLALLVLDDLRKCGIIELTEAEIQSGIENTTWAGRLEWLTDNILLDGAHNIDGITSIVNYLQQQNFPKLKILVAILADKDYSEMITLLESLSAEFFVTNVPLDMVGDSAEQVDSCFTSQVTTFENYEEALAQLVDLSEDETLVVCGSLYLISAVRKELLAK